MRAHSQDGPFGYPGYAPYYMRNLFQEYTYNDAGVLAIHGRMVHVIYNSHYQGIVIIIVPLLYYCHYISYVLTNNNSLVLIQIRNSSFKRENVTN
jgi:hypothetical protein